MIAPRHFSKFWTVAFCLSVACFCEMTESSHTSAAEPADNQVQAETLSTEVREQLMRGISTVSATADVYGGWVEEATAEKPVKVLLVVDQGTPAETTARVAEEFKTATSGSGVNVEFIHWPVKAVIAAVRKTLASDSKLSGAQLTDLHIDFEPGLGAEIQLIGEVKTLSQRDRLLQAAKRVIGQQKWSVVEAPPVPKDAFIVLAKPDDKKFLDALRKEIAATPTLTLCEVNSVVWEQSETPRGRLHLVGKIAVVSQADGVRKAAERVLRDQGRARSELPEIYTEDLKVVPPRSTFLAHQFQRAISVEPQFQGCFIARVAVRDDGGYALVGRILKPKQDFAMIEFLQQHVVHTLFGKDAVLEIHPSLNDQVGLKEMPSSRQRASYFAGQGMTLYRRGEFEKAREQLEKAVVESPTSLEYKFWLTAAELASGDREIAVARIRGIISTQRDRSGPPSLSVAGKLEFVRSSIRFQIAEIENEIMDEQSAGGIIDR